MKRSALAALGLVTVAAAFAAGRTTRPLPKSNTVVPSSLVSHPVAPIAPQGQGEKQQQDGLYVRGMYVSLATPIERVKAGLGADDERFEEEAGTVTHVWRFTDGTGFVATSDKLGALKSASLWSDAPNKNADSYAVLGSRRIRSGDLTLAEVRREFPEGQVEGPLPGAGDRIVLYTVRMRPEARPVMVFHFSDEIAPHETLTGWEDVRLNEITIR